jgi:hypothetical protein
MTIFYIVSVVFRIKSNLIKFHSVLINFDHNFFQDLKIFTLDHKNRILIFAATIKFTKSTAKSAA